MPKEFWLFFSLQQPLLLLPDSSSVCLCHGVSMDGGIDRGLCQVFVSAIDMLRKLGSHLVSQVAAPTDHAIPGVTPTKNIQIYWVAC